MSGNMEELYRGSVSASAPLKALTLESMFWRADHAYSSDWTAHIPWLFWLLQSVSPSNCVTIGGHWGGPHAVFCQGLHRLKSDGRAVLVASDETVPANIQFTCERRYGSVSKHLKEDWLASEVILDIEPIDILALDIDFSELKAASSKVQERLDQLIERASIILIPGIKKISDGLVCSTLFERLSSKYQSILFGHGDGLGVIFKSLPENELLKTLILRWSSNKSKKTIEDIFAHLGRGCEDQALVEEQSRKIHDFNKELSELGEKYDKKSIEALSLSQSLDNSAAIAEQKDISIQARFSEIAKITQIAEARENEISRLKEKANYLENQLSLKDGLIENHLNQIEYFSSKLKEVEAAERYDSVDIKEKYRSSLDSIRGKDLEIEQLREKEKKFSTLETSYKDKIVSLQRENTLMKSRHKDKSREYRRIIQQGNIEIRRRDEELSKMASLLNVESERNIKLIENLRRFNLEQSGVPEGFRQQESQAHNGAYHESRKGSWSTFFSKKSSKPKDKEAEEISASEYFDADWYLKHYPDVAEHPLYAGCPALHYLLYGAFEDRNPSPHFESQWYLDNNPDVARSRMNPLLHFLRNGLEEERSPTSD